MTTTIQQAVKEIRSKVSPDYYIVKNSDGETLREYDYDEYSRMIDWFFRREVAKWYTRRSPKTSSLIAYITLY
jgi:hypothetical protein